MGVLVCVVIGLCLWCICRGVTPYVARVARATPIFLSTKWGNFEYGEHILLPKSVGNTNNFDEMTPLDIINPFKLIFQDECQNYVRFLAQTDSQSLLVCGTNSFKPKCRTYTTVREVLKTPNHNNNKTASSDNNTTSATVTTTSQPQLIDDGILRKKHEFDGTGVCPLDPRHNSTAIFSGNEI